MVSVHASHTVQQVHHTLEYATADIIDSLLSESQESYCCSILITAAHLLVAGAVACVGHLLLGLSQVTAMACLFWEMTACVVGCLHSHRALPGLHLSV